MEKRDYWFGLYKLEASRHGTTVWYDGNPSKFRDWAKDEPSGGNICIRYTRKGFKDHSCSVEFYYTCKKAAGKFYAIVTCLYNVF